MSEQVDPLGDPGAQSLLDGLGINFDVSNGGTGRQGLDLLLHSSVLGNLSLKPVQNRVFLGAILKLLALSSQVLLSNSVLRSMDDNIA